MPSQQLLNLIKEAMKDERHDYKKYRLMMNMTSSAQIKDQIRFAYADEGVHYKLFRQLYYRLTGKYIDVATPPVVLKKTLIGNVKTSFNGELAAVELYRKIRSMLDSKYNSDVLYRIITDEQEHADRFGYVYTILRT